MAHREKSLRPISAAGPEASAGYWAKDGFWMLQIATSTYSTIEADHNKFLIKRKLIFLVRS
jgi:hypothetical protein